MGKTTPIIEMLATLEAACKKGNPADDDDHVIFFHIRDMVLDIIRHGDKLAELAASAGERSRWDILRAMNELRLEFTTETLPHWQYHLNELEMELKRRKPRPGL